MSFIKEVNDWVESHNPSPKQIELATNRASVCENVNIELKTRILN